MIDVEGDVLLQDLSFQDHFTLCSAEKTNLTEFYLFASHIYVISWTACPVACDAPVDNLQLYKKLM